MVTTVGTESSLSRLLEHLVQLDYAAIEAYKAAEDRLDDASLKSSLSEFRADHERHTQELGRMLLTMGGQPPSGGGMKQLLTKGKVVIADLGGDKRILQAMKTNEDDTNTAYDRALTNSEVNDEVRAVLERNLSDERRHREWIETTLQQL